MVDLPGFKNGRYLTVAEVALAMRVSKMTVYRLIHAGGLHSVRFRAARSHTTSPQTTIDPRTVQAPSGQGEGKVVGAGPVAGR